MNARRRTAGCAALATALVLAGAPAASAAPTGCTYQLNQAERWASSYCPSGTGEHRIHVIQRHFLPEVGLIPIEGPWVPAGQTSYTGITPHTTVSVWVDTRG